MPLDESCEIYLGRLLVVRPCEYSWCWRLADSSGKTFIHVSDEGPEPFRFRVQDFVFVADRMVGAVGLIEQPGHVFDLMQIIVTLSQSGVSANFTDKLGDFDIEIGTNLSIEEDAELEFPDGYPILFGFGWVGASLKSIDANIRRSVKRMKHEKAEQ